MPNFSNCRPPGIADAGWRPKLRRDFKAHFKRRLGDPADDLARSKQLRFVVALTAITHALVILTNALNREIEKGRKIWTAPDRLPTGQNWVSFRCKGDQLGECQRSSSTWDLRRSAGKTTDGLVSGGFGSGMTLPSDGHQGDKPAGERNRLHFRSPWLEQLDRTAPPQPLDRDLTADVVVVGAGIAGVATAYFILRDTPNTVVMVERSRVGHGASGRNAGQLVTYFERPLCSLVDAYGFDMATRAQAEVDSAWDLLDEILVETRIPARIERFDGVMGMYTLNHVLVHLRGQLIRRKAGLTPEHVKISDRAPFIEAIPLAFDGLYEVVPQSLIKARLASGDDEYLAVLVNRKGCGNSALICQELLDFLQRTYAERFTYFDHTTVDQIILHSSDATVHCGDHVIAASRVVLCTNGFNHHKVENRVGDAIGDDLGNNVDSIIGYMAGFLGPAGAPPDATSYIRNAEIGGKLPYYYVTRRSYLLGTNESTLTCLGGPEARVDAGAPYEPYSDMPATMMRAFDEEVRPVVVPDGPAGADYDFAWHGLMGYTKDKIRLVGFEPRNPVLMYNLGCNGVGFLPSIAGGRRIARLHRGEALVPSIFDPK